MITFHIISPSLTFCTWFVTELWRFFIFLAHILCPVTTLTAILAGRPRFQFIRLLTPMIYCYHRFSRNLLSIRKAASNDNDNDMYPTQHLSLPPYSLRTLSSFQDTLSNLSYLFLYSSLFHKTVIKNINRGIKSARHW